MRKFEVLGVIGIGAYGIVLKAKNKETNEISTFYSILDRWA
jgi:cyclin-dependent kinase-like